MHLTGKNIIGQNFSSGTENFFQAIFPEDGLLSDYAYPVASAGEIDQAMTLARQAAARLSTLPANEKALFLEAIAENILDLGDLLLKTCQRETGLPEARLSGERGRTINQIRMFAGLVRDGSWVEASIDLAIRDRQPAPKPDIRKMLFPVGPVVVFGASNFPLAFSVAGGDTISALAAGNPVIVKAHPAHPATSDLVGQCIAAAAKQCGLPEGTFSLLYDSGFSVGQTLVSHPLTSAVGFTGSFSGGKALFDLAMRRQDPIPVFAEMGSVNPVFVLPSAITGQAGQTAGKIASSVTLGAGQFCTNPGLIFVENTSATPAFLESLAGAIAANLPQTMLTPSIADRYQSGFYERIDTECVSLLATSRQDPALNQGRPAVASVTGTAFEMNPDLADEVFGPFTLVVLCDSREQLFRLAQNLKGQLTITVFYEDPSELTEYSSLIAIAREKAGRIVFNGVPTGVEVCASMHHGGPYPASTDSRFSSVGTSAIKRWARPVAFQDCPESLLPPELKSGNQMKIWRSVNGQFTTE